MAREIPAADWIAGLVHLGLSEQEAAHALDSRPTWTSADDGDDYGETRREDRTGGTHWRDEQEDRATRRRGK